MRNNIPVIGFSLAASVAAAPQFEPSFYGSAQQQNRPAQFQDGYKPQNAVESVGAAPQFQPSFAGPSRQQTRPAQFQDGYDSQNAAASSDARKPDGAKQGATPVYYLSYPLPTQGGGQQGGIQENGPQDGWPLQGEFGPKTGPSQHQQLQGGAFEKNGPQEGWPSQGEFQPKTGPSQHQQLQSGASKNDAPLRGWVYHGASSQDISSQDGPSRTRFYHLQQQQTSAVVVTVTQTTTPTPRASQPSRPDHLYQGSQSGIPIEAFTVGLPTRGPLIENGNVIGERDLSGTESLPVGANDPVSRDLQATETGNPKIVAIDIAKRDEDLIIPASLKDIAAKLQSDLKDKIEGILAAAKVNDIIAKIVELIGALKSSDIKEQIADKIPEFLGMIKELFSMDKLEELKGNVQDVLKEPHGIAEVSEWAGDMLQKVKNKEASLKEDLMGAIEGLKDGIGGLVGGGGDGDGDDFGVKRDGEPTAAADDKASGHFYDTVKDLKETFGSPEAKEKEKELIKAEREKVLKAFDDVLDKGLDLSNATSFSSHDVRVPYKATLGYSAIHEIRESFKEKALDFLDVTDKEKEHKDLFPEIKAKAEKKVKEVVKDVLDSIQGDLPHVSDKGLGEKIKKTLGEHEVAAMRDIADIADKFNKNDVDGVKKSY